MSQINSETLVKLRSNDPALTQLDLSNQKLDATDIAILVTALENNTSLRTLDVGANSIGDNGANALALLTNLNSLAVYNCEIGTAGAQPLATSTHLRTLDISYNEIGDLTAELFSNNTHLTSLNVNRTQISAEAAKKLAKNTQLKSLELAYNGFGDDVAIAFGPNNHLTFLNLANLYESDNRVTDAGANALATNDHLTRLNLSDNSITHLSAENFKCNTNLICLDLYRNSFGPRGAALLALNTHLTILDLSHNQVGEEGAICLSRNTHLQALNLSSNELTCNAVKALAKNTTLTSLDLTYNSKMSVGVSDFFNNTTLTTFSMSTFSVFDLDLETALKKTVALNKKAKDLLFVEQVTIVAQGNRNTPQNLSLLKNLPSEILLIILGYVAGNTLGKPEAITNICQFIFANIKRSGKSHWRLGDGKITFFKVWNEEERKEVELRFAKQSAATNVVVLN